MKPHQMPRFVAAINRDEPGVIIFAAVSTCPPREELLECAARSPISSCIEIDVRPLND
jgi:hypothetical protein